MSGPRSDRRRRRLEDLSDDVVDRMIAILEPFVSPERTARIDAAIASRTRDLVLVLEDLYDDHNASAVLRTAEAFGGSPSSSAVSLDSGTGPGRGSSITGREDTSWPE